MKLLTTLLIMIIVSPSIYASEVCGKVEKITFTKVKNAVITFQNDRETALSEGITRFDNTIKVSDKVNLAAIAMANDLTFCNDNERNITTLKH